MSSSEQVWYWQYGVSIFLPAFKKNWCLFNVVYKQVISMILIMWNGDILVFLEINLNNLQLSRMLQNAHTWTCFLEKTSPPPPPPPKKKKKNTHTKKTTRKNQQQKPCKELPSTSARYLHSKQSQPNKTPCCDCLVAKLQVCLFNSLSIELYEETFMCYFCIGHYSFRHRWHRCLKSIPSKTETCLCYTINSIAVDDLAPFGSSADMVLIRPGKLKPQHQQRLRSLMFWYFPENIAVNG